MDKSFDELLALLDIPHTKGSGWYEDRKLKVERWLELQQNNGKPLVTSRACPNCKETVEICGCIRNKCIRCGDAVGNITFTVCDKCWDIEHGR